MWFPERNLPVITISVVPYGVDYLVRGISEDVTVFDHAHFQSLREIKQYFGHGSQTSNAFRVVFDIHPSCHEEG